MTGPIKSDTGTTNDAISKYDSSGNVSSKTSTLGESNLSGMKTAMQVSNKIVGDLMKLKTSTKKQAENHLQWQKNPSLKEKKCQPFVYSTES